LVTTGPYRWLRHPFYVGVLLLVLACFLLAANWFMALAGFAVFALLAIRSPIEERKLAERFGDEYLAYRARTRRFLPRVW
jgi:protein-S-isoprenylcysteine O-methyltransferase Ste14